MIASEPLWAMGASGAVSILPMLPIWEGTATPAPALSDEVLDAGSSNTISGRFMYDRAAITIGAIALTKIA